MGQPLVFRIFNNDLGRNRAGVFYIYSKVLLSVNLHQAKVDYGLHQLQERSSKICSALKALRRAVIYLYKEVSHFLPASSAAEAYFKLNFFFILDLTFYEAAIPFEGLALRFYIYH